MEKDVFPEKEFEKIILCHVTEKNDEESDSEIVKPKKRVRAIESEQESVDLTCNENFIGGIEEADAMSLSSIESSPYKKNNKRDKK